MLYAVIQRFDSLREIETSMTAEVRKLHHVGINSVPDVAPCRMQMPDGQRSSSKKYIATYMLPIRTFFPRTADAMVRKNG